MLVFRLFSEKFYTAVGEGGLGKQTKRNYFARKFQQFKGDCESTWKQINSIIPPYRINEKILLIKFVKMTLHM